jgi:predicted nucleotidyltransferase component of viral defense system
MDDFARFATGDRADAFVASSRARGIGAGLLEKDFWVCWTLRRLYALEGLPTGILFKGGTSLSKVFKAIERFSEDIDLSLDRAALGFDDDVTAASSSRKQRERQLSQLSERCRAFIRETLLPRLTNSFSDALPNTGWRLEIATDDPDQQTLLFFYPSAVQTTSSYIRPTVRMEFGARSDQWPSLDADIRPYVAEDFTDLFKAPSTRVHALAGERTFWEKVTALHAWHHHPSPMLAERRSRHYYDVVRLYEQEIGKRAAKDTHLLDQVAKHKASFFASTGARYDLARPGTLRLMPAVEQVDALRRDYQNMEEMFFGERPSFDQLMAALNTIERIINMI